MPDITIHTPDGAILGPNPWQAAKNLIGDWYTGPGQTITVDDLRADPDWPAELPTQALRDALRAWVKSGQMERIGRGVYRFT